MHASWVTRARGGRARRACGATRSLGFEAQPGLCLPWCQQRCTCTLFLGFCHSGLRPNLALFRLPTVCNALKIMSMYPILSSCHVGFLPTIVCVRNLTEVRGPRIRAHCSRLGALVYCSALGTVIGRLRAASYSTGHLAATSRTHVPLRAEPTRVKFAGPGLGLVNSSLSSTRLPHARLHSWSDQPMDATGAAPPLPPALVWTGLAPCSPCILSEARTKKGGDAYEGGFLWVGGLLVSTLR
mmetsp:Transcript_30417/g.90160  ORF Transcript_30417/g.90160 Transcript_30417/m.90160 type:complete len:241 (-) Transcript_30417:755-1477(-)